MNHYTRTTGSSKRSWSIARNRFCNRARLGGTRKNRSVKKRERQSAVDELASSIGWGGGVQGSLVTALNITGGRSVGSFVNERKSVRRAIISKAPLRANLHELLKRRCPFFPLVWYRCLQMRRMYKLRRSFPFTHLERGNLRNFQYRSLVMIDVLLQRIGYFLFFNFFRLPWNWWLLEISWQLFIYLVILILKIKKNNIHMINFQSA